MTLFTSEDLKIITRHRLPKWLMPLMDGKWFWVQGKSNHVYEDNKHPYLPGKRWQRFGGKCIWRSLWRNWLFFITAGVTELNCTSRLQPNRTRQLDMNPADTNASATNQMFTVFVAKNVKEQLIHGPRSPSKLIQILSSFLLFKSEFDVEMQKSEHVKWNHLSCL